MRVKRIGLSLMATAGLLISASAADSGRMSVQVKQGAVRATPSFTGQVVSSLAYGTGVQTLEKKPGWIKVSAGETTGWMHASSLTGKKIVLSGGTTTAHSGASSEELALAGKGFNADVEAQFKAKNRNANFAAVDHMERRQTRQQEKTRFVQEGGLR